MGGMLQLEAGLEAGRRGFKTMQFKMLYAPNGRSAEELVMIQVHLQLKSGHFGFIHHWATFIGKTARRQRFQLSSFITGLRLVIMSCGQSVLCHTMVLIVGCSSTHIESLLVHFWPCKSFWSRLSLVLTEKSTVWIASHRFHHISLTIDW